MPIFQKIGCIFNSILSYFFKHYRSRESWCISASFGEHYGMTAYIEGFMMQLMMSSSWKRKILIIKCLYGHALILVRNLGLNYNNFVAIIFLRKFTLDSYKFHHYSSFFVMFLEEMKETSVYRISCKIRAISWRRHKVITYFWPAL